MSDAMSIEELIDRWGLAHVLIVISDICHEKAQHVEENWQDRSLAARWDSAGKAVRKFSSSVTVRRIDTEHGKR